MADNSPSVELAPLKGSIILDLDQFDEDIKNAEDKVVNLAELFKVALNPNISIDFNNFNESIDEAVEKIKNFKSDINGLNESVNVDVNIKTKDSIDELHKFTNKINDEQVGHDDINEIFPLTGNIDEAPQEELNNIGKAANEAKEDVNKLGDSLESIGSRASDVFSDAFSEMSEKAGDLLNSFDSALARGISQKAKNLAESINATINKEIFKDEEYDIESDDADLDPANISGRGGGIPPIIPPRGGGAQEEEEDSWFEKMGEHGSKMFEKGMMLNWTITPFFEKVDKSILTLGFTYETALNMANREFGKNSFIVDKWSKNTINSMGLSSGMALNMADRFGLSAKSMGANKLQAAQLAERMTTLADQLSLATGGQISLSSASQVLTSAMGGQMYGLKQLGISFSTSQENAEAAALGYGKAFSALTPLQSSYVITNLLQKSLNGSLGTLSDNLGTAYGQWSKTKAQLEETAETMGIQLMPSIIKVMHTITKLVTWFSHLGKTAHILVEAFLLIGVVVGPMLMILGSLFSIIGNGILIFSKFGKLIEGSARGILKLGKIIGRCIDDAKGIITIFEKIGETILDVGEILLKWGIKFIEVTGEIIDAIDPITLAITGLVLVFTGAAVEIYEHWNAIKKSFVNGFKYIKNEFKIFEQDCKRIMDNIWKGIKKGISNIVKTFKYIGKDFEKSTKYVSKGCKDILHDIVNVGENILNSIKKTVKKIYEAIYNNPIIHAVGYICFQLNHMFKELDLAIVRIIDALCKYIWSWIKHYGDLIYEYIENVSNKICNSITYFTGIVEHSISSFFKYIWRILLQATKEQIHLVESFCKYIGNLVEESFDYVKGKFEDFCTWLGEIILTPIHAIEYMMKAIKSYVENILNETVNNFKNIWSGLVSWFDSDVLKPVKAVDNAMMKFGHFVFNGIKIAGNYFKSGWKDLVSWFRTWVEEPLKIINSTLNDWNQAGENVIKALLDGIKNAFVGLCDWLGNKMSSIASDISGFSKHAVSSLNNASYHGSHATGLNHVPWDGYTAQLHKGEMVLTKDQAQQYRNGQSSGNGAVNVTINSPQPLDPFEVKRQMEQYSRNLANGIY